MVLCSCEYVSDKSGDSHPDIDHLSDDEHDGNLQPPLHPSVHLHRSLPLQFVWNDLKTPLLLPRCSLPWHGNHPVHLRQHYES